MDDREYDLSAAQKAVKAKYPPVSKKYQWHDMLSLLYNFMNEWLYQFSAEMFFIPREMKVIYLDRVNYKIRSIGWGESFDLAKHPQLFLSYRALKSKLSHTLPCKFMRTINLKFLS
ncbi:protein archease isoform X1 [Scyliorhinus canicula]|uniref:protein archease isoform X1 n=1 Tax=Scyliorhinus canicula TaxID=7830 RepID=UPI0018F45A50|nr:protein archease isoform X1 [Scyliorhinus canicula]